RRRLLLRLGRGCARRSERDPHHEPRRATSPRPPGPTPPRPRVHAPLHTCPPITVPRAVRRPHTPVPQNAPEGPLRTTKKTDGRLSTPARLCRGALPGVPVHRGHRVVPALCARTVPNRPPEPISLKIKRL